MPCTDSLCLDCQVSPSSFESQVFSFYLQDSFDPDELLRLTDENEISMEIKSKKSKDPPLTSAPTFQTTGIDKKKSSKTKVCVTSIICSVGIITSDRN